MNRDTANQARIALPAMCQTHQALLVHQCGYGPQDPWRALLIATQIALFQGATTDPKVHAEIAGKIEGVSRLGCLACRKPDLFGTLIDTVQRTFPREAHIGAIKQLGERWVTELAKAEQAAAGAVGRNAGPGGVPT